MNDGSFFRDAVILSGKAMILGTVYNFFSFNFEVTRGIEAHFNSILINFTDHDFNLPTTRGINKNPITFLP